MNNFLIAAGISLCALIPNWNAVTPSFVRWTAIDIFQTAPKDTFVMNYLKRNIRYPKTALKHNQEKTLYLILKCKNNGTIDQYEIRDSLDHPTMRELVIVGAYNTENPISFTDSANLNTELFAKSLQSAVDKIKIPQKDLIDAKQYYFKISFRIEKIFDRLVEPY